MRAVELTGFEGFESLRTVQVDTPKPRTNEVLIAVKAAGINFAEIELTKGKYPSSKPLPFFMGFEAAGTVAKLGSKVKTLKEGDKVAALVSSGGYAVCDCRRKRLYPDARRHFLCRGDHRR